MTVSAIANDGLENIWSIILQHRQIMEQQGEFAKIRAKQQHQWMWTMLKDRLIETFTAREDVQQRFEVLEQGVKEGKTNPTTAVEEIIKLMLP